MIRTFLAIFILAVSAIAQTGGVPGQPKPVKADQVAGNDGTTLRALKTDANGQLIVTAPTGASSNQVQGAAANNAAPQNPVEVSGFDAGNSVQRAISVNSTGIPVNIVPAADADAAPNNPTGFGVTNLGSAPLAVFNHCFNGTTWDRCRGNTDGWFIGKNASGSDGLANTLAFPQANAGAGLVVTPTIFNGTTHDRQRSPALANFPTAATTTARNSIGGGIGEFGSRFTVNSAPAAGSQATASIAAEASVRHVATGLCFSSGSAVAPVLTSLQVNLRDGATGAGTVLISFEVEIPASTGVDTAPFCTQFTGGIAGTTNTAMTVEWSASLANLKQTATLIGYNVN